MYEAKPLELSEADMNVAPMQLELTLATRELNSVSSDKLMRILKAHPGKDPVICTLTKKNGKTNEGGVASYYRFEQFAPQSAFGGFVWTTCLESFVVKQTLARL